MLIKLEWSRYCMVKELWQYVETVFIQYRNHTDERMDGQTDRIPISIACVSMLTRDKKGATVLHIVLPPIPYGGFVFCWRSCGTCLLLLTCAKQWCSKVDKKLSCRRQTAQCVLLNISLSHSRSLKVTENGTSRKHGYSFLFAFHSNYGSYFVSFTR